MATERIVTINGTALPIRGNNVDTDRILPARFLKSISFEGLERHLFEDDRVQAGGRHPLSNMAYQGAALMFVNANFGCGSSREHAPQAIRRRGIGAVVGESFSEIFFGNSVALGMPCPTVDPAAASQLQTLAEREPRTVFTLDLASMIIRGGGVEFPIALPPGARESFMDGSWDATGLLLERYDEVRAVAARLPYLSY
ncbi:MAG: 3-isopropylmalate dehydratase small subunit [Vicinamibacterales bacterium]